MTAKTWFITGCSTGFGRVLTEELLKTDAQIVATARNVAALDDLNGKRLLKLALDVTQPKAITSGVEQAVKNFGRIDVLVNNAGYGMVGAIEESDIDAVRRMFETNVFGLIQMTQAVLPVMRAQQSGYIVNMSSVAGVVPTGGFGMYNGTKHAVEGISGALAQEVAPLGIKVTCIEPGPFRTDFAGRSIDTQKSIPAYEATVGKTRKMLEGMNNNQPGDPVRASQIIIELANEPNPPLHMPLGNNAFDRMTAKIKSWQELLLQLEKRARSSDFS
jgi:NAD(P)-dependent dehydrogenase (short-subunit alcohol dehydrogenase family)